jgi:hypothetical protein
LNTYYTVFSDITCILSTPFLFTCSRGLAKERASAPAPYSPASTAITSPKYLLLRNNCDQYSATCSDVAMYKYLNPRPVIKRPRMSMPYVFGTRWTTTPTIMMTVEIRTAQILPKKSAKVPPIQSCAKEIVAHDTAAIVPVRSASILKYPRAAHLSR